LKAYTSHNHLGRDDRWSKQQRDQKSLGKNRLEKEVHVGIKALPESLAGHAYDQD